MTSNVIQNLKMLIPLRFCLWALVALPGQAHAWTDASLSEVRVTVTVAPSGQSRVATTARFEVQGGKFHGFDLAPMEDGELVQEECAAVLDDGRRFPLSFRPLKDGRTRVALASEAAVKQSGVTFTLLHRTDLVEAGALRAYAGRARLDWTPLVWDEGTNLMSVEVVLPGASEDAPIAVDPAVSVDYAVETTALTASFVKHRTVRWYPMQVVVDFDPSLVYGLEPAETAPAAAAAVAPGLDRTPGGSPPPLHIAVLPWAALLIGLLLLARKSWFTERALRDLGIEARYRLLPHTGRIVRSLLSAGACALALGAQWHGSLAASVPALAVASGLWLVRREAGSIRPRPGGEWRRMTDESLHAYRRLAAAYRARRRSWLDITTPAGVVTFLLLLAAVGYAATVARGDWPRVAWATVLNALLTAVPTWFANVRSELPVDATIEGFNALRKWRSALARMVGSRAPGADASFWVREDAKGAIEVRLRVEPAPDGLSRIEVAGEVVRSGSTVRCRKAVVLRMEPGTESARRLAACPYAAEHHLTPDFQEEIIVLRNRRGNTDKGLAPLRAVLGLLSGPARSA